MSYTLSLVNVVPDVHREAINLIYTAYRAGDNALSVKLVDTNGAIYWGSHAWYKPWHYAYFMDEEIR